MKTLLTGASRVVDAHGESVLVVVSQEVGQAALTILERSVTLPAIVTTDLEMAGVGGEELARMMARRYPGASGRLTFLRIQEAEMRAKLLLAVLAVALASTGTGCKKKSPAPTMGKESTTVDTTKKK